MNGTDADILKLWRRSRDAEAFAEIVARYSKMVYATCLRVLGNSVDAEDVAQQCFADLAQHPQRVRSSLAGWLHRMATHRSVDRLRSEKSRRQREVSYAASQKTMAVGDDEGLRTRLDEAATALKPAHRDVIVLRFFRGMTQEEVANQLGISLRTVQYRQQRAVESIRRRLKTRDAAPALSAIPLALKDLMQPATPAKLTAELGRLALTGGQAAPASSLTGLLASCAGMLSGHRTAAIALVLLAVISGYGLLRGRSAPPGLPGATELVETQKVAATEAAPPDSTPGVEQESAATLVAEEKEVDLSDPQAVWAKVLEVNEPWLRMSPPEYLRYTFNMSVSRYDPSPEHVSHAWLWGETGRWEMDDTHALIFDDNRAAYLKPRGLLESSPMAWSRDEAFWQAVTWRTALHVLARAGLPESAQIMSPDDGNAETVILDVEDLNGRGRVGLGIMHTWFGQCQYPVNRARIHIRASDFVPIQEETTMMASGGVEERHRIDIGPEFFQIGSKRAPKEMLWHGQEMSFGAWQLRIRFQLVGSRWLLDEGENLQNGKPVRFVWVSNASYKPFDTALVKPPEPHTLASWVEALKQEWPPAEHLADTSDPSFPTVVAVYPEHQQENVPCDTELRVTFDQPMNPNVSDLNVEGGVDAIGTVRYDSQRYEFIVPVSLRPHMRYYVCVNPTMLDRPGSKGFVSEDGQFAVPFRWGFATEAATPEPVPAGPQPITETDDANEKELRRILAAVRQARQTIWSLEEVVRISRPGAGGLSMTEATFRFQGDTQWYADISSVMNCRAFVVGCDGQQWWYYYSDSTGEKESLKMAGMEAIEEQNLSILDPWGGGKAAVERFFAQAHPVYVGVREFDRRECHVVRSRIGNAKAEMWIDAETLLPAHSIIEYSNDNRVSMSFEVRAKNTTLPDSAFLPPAPEHIEPERDEALEPGYDRRFVTIDDGADGRMSVRWGMRGPAGIKSGGLN